MAVHIVKGERDLDLGGGGAGRVVSHEQAGAPFATQELLAADRGIGALIGEVGPPLLDGSPCSRGRSTNSGGGQHRDSQAGDDENALHDSLRFRLSTTS